MKKFFAIASIAMLAASPVVVAQSGQDIDNASGTAAPVSGGATGAAENQVLTNSLIGAGAGLAVVGIGIALAADSDDGENVNIATTTTTTTTN